MMELDNTMKMRVIHKDRGCHNCSRFKHISERIQPSGHISETGRCTASVPWAFMPNDNLDYGHMLLTWRTDNGVKANLVSIYAETCYMQLGICVIWKAKRVPKSEIVIAADTVNEIRKSIKKINTIIPKKPGILEKAATGVRKRFDDIVFKREDGDLSGAEEEDTKDKEE